MLPEAGPLRLQTGNVMLVAAAGTITLGGILITSVASVPSAIWAPPVGAAAVRVTVACEITPAATLVGSSVKVDIAAGSLSGGGTKASHLSARRLRKNVPPLGSGTGVM